MPILVKFWVKLSEEKDSVSKVSEGITFDSEESLDDSQADYFDDIIPLLEEQTGAVITDPESQIELYSITPYSG